MLHQQAGGQRHIINLGACVHFLVSYYLVRGSMEANGYEEAEGRRVRPGKPGEAKGKGKKGGTWMQEASATLIHPYNVWDPKS